MSVKISLTVPEKQKHRHGQNSKFFTNFSNFHMSTGQRLTPGIFLTSNLVAGNIFKFLSKFHFQILWLLRENSGNMQDSVHETYYNTCIW